MQLATKMALKRAPINNRHLLPVYNRYGTLFSWWLAHAWNATRPIISLFFLNTLNLFRPGNFRELSHFIASTPYMIFFNLKTSLNNPLAWFLDTWSAFELILSVLLTSGAITYSAQWNKYNYLIIIAAVVCPFFRNYWILSKANCHPRASNRIGANFLRLFTSAVTFTISSASLVLIVNECYNPSFNVAKLDAMIREIKKEAPPPKAKFEILFGNVLYVTQPFVMTSLWALCAILVVLAWRVPYGIIECKGECQRRSGNFKGTWRWGFLRL